MLATDPITTPPSTAPPEPACCDHCGEPCVDGEIVADRHVFCCLGCRTVWEILAEHGLGRYYRLEERPGISMAGKSPGRFAHLDNPEILDRLLDFRHDGVARITLEIPSIHCVACVWLLENLFRLEDGIGESQVDFRRRRVTLTFEPEKISLGRLVERLTSLGYEPSLTLDDLDRRPADPAARRLALQLGVTGFCFGNIMLMTFPAYLGLEPSESLAGLFGWLSLGLAIPVVTFGAADYWRAAWLGFRRRLITIDFPIALGLAALFGESLWQVTTRGGEGYLDSLAALVFLLLCGRWFQRRTWERLSFDRDYTAYFPLAVARRSPRGDEETIPLTAVAPGDRLVLRNGELIPADGRLEAGRAAIDYSFVTGESLPVARDPGDVLYAGGRQVGPAIEMVVEREVSQSYLVSLWSDEAFRSRSEHRVSIDDLTNRIAKTFTAVVVAIAGATALYWSIHDPSVALRAFTSVLIVACPCALALAAPFALGTAQRALGRRGLYLRHPAVIEALARARTYVFDKTGTLTEPGVGSAEYHGAPLAESDRIALATLLDGSAHPYARLVRRVLGEVGQGSTETFREEPGRGLVGTVDGRPVVCGSLAWLRENGITVPVEPADGGVVLVATRGRYRGRFVLRSGYRRNLAPMFAELRKLGRLALTSGDNDRERDALRSILGPEAKLVFEQSPHDKLALVRRLQASSPVLMVGDGLNDAGALEQSDVGLAVSEDVANFSPACDGILEAGRMTELPRHLDYARRAVGVVVVCVGVSFAYNVVGIAFAASGNLSPLVSALLMPTSSATVVGLAVGLTRRLARTTLGET